MAKSIIGYIKLQIPAGQANPSPPVGPALGQRGLNIMEFCKAFNSATENLEKGMPIPVEIAAYNDKSFTFVTKSPPASYFIMKAAGLKKASQTPGREKIAKITIGQCKEIAEAKQKDLNSVSIEGAVEMIKGSARSMGIEVVES